MDGRLQVIAFVNFALNNTPTMPDQKAVQILFDMYWSPSGWKSERDRSISAEDFEYAKSQGVMFDPFTTSHQDVLERLLRAVISLTPHEVGDAFLASLSCRRLDWRSALGSYAVFRHMPLHDAAGTTQCEICGLYPDGADEDLNVLNFERLKWGGIRHGYPIYALLDLELFLAGPRPSPTPDDVVLFESLIASLRAAPADATSGTLNKVLPKALKANKAERDVMIGMLGFIGVLATVEHPGFACKFVRADSRSLPQRRFVDMAYPACWWRKPDGVRVEMLEQYFGHRITELPAPSRLEIT